MKMPKQSMSEEPYPDDQIVMNGVEDEGGESEDGTDAQTLYDMFCEMDGAEQKKALKMCQAYMDGEEKKPMRASDDREFRPMEKGDK